MNWTVSVRLYDCIPRLFVRTKATIYFCKMRICYFWEMCSVIGQCKKDPLLVLDKIWFHCHFYIQENHYTACGFVRHKCIKGIYIIACLCLFWLQNMIILYLLKGTVRPKIKAEHRTDILKEGGDQTTQDHRDISRIIFFLVPRIILNSSCKINDVMLPLQIVCSFQMHMCSLFKRLFSNELNTDAYKSGLHNYVQARKRCSPLNKAPSRPLTPPSLCIESVRITWPEKGEYVNCILSCSLVPAFLSSRICSKEEKNHKYNRRRSEYGGESCVFDTDLLYTGRDIHGFSRNCLDLYVNRLYTRHTNEKKSKQIRRF